MKTDRTICLNSKVNGLQPSLEYRIYDWGGVSTAITTCFLPNIKMMENGKPIIRKFTNRECFRLMGVNDQDIDKIQASGVSESQQYKLAGNSIVVDVLFYIYTNLFIENDKPEDTLF